MRSLVFNPPRLRSSLPIDFLLGEHEGLALEVAKRMQSFCGEPLEDLQQLSMAGLLKAIMRFDPTSGYCFSSFAVPYCKGEILHFLRDHGELFKVPRRAREAAARVYRQHRLLIAKGLNFPIVKVAAAMEIEEDEWLWLEQATSNKSIAPLDEEWQQSAEPQFSEDPEHQPLQEAIARLPFLQYEVTIDRYYLGMSDQQIATRHNLSLSELQCCESAALEALRTALES